MPSSATRTSRLRPDRPRRHADVAAGRSELERVAQKVHEHLLEPPHIAEQRRFGNGRHLNLDLIARRQRNDRFHDPAKERLRVDRLEIEGRSSAGNPREIEQIVDELRLPRRVSMDGFDRLRHDARIDRTHAQHRRPSENRVQRRAKLVRYGRHELVFQLVGRLSFRARPFRLFVQARAIEGLRAVLRHRDQQRLIVVVEVHGRAEMKFEHAKRSALDEKRQSGRGREALSAASDAERQYFSCSSPATRQRPASSSRAHRSRRSPARIRASVVAEQLQISPSLAPTTIGACSTMARVTATTLAASDSPAVRACRRVVLVASARYRVSLARSATSVF